jgi:hypothetical protein
MKPDDKPSLSDYEPLGSQSPIHEDDDRLFVPREERKGWKLNWRRPDAWIIAAAFVLVLLPRSLEPEFARDLMPYARLLVFVVMAYLFIRGLRGDDAN